MRQFFEVLGVCFLGLIAVAVLNVLFNPHVLGDGELYRSRAIHTVTLTCTTDHNTRVRCTQRLKP